VTEARRLRALRVRRRPALRSRCLTSAPTITDPAQLDAAPAAEHAAFVRWQEAYARSSLETNTGRAHPPADVVHVGSPFGTRSAVGDHMGPPTHGTGTAAD
jgi:hypothetical protein